MVRDRFGFFFEEVVRALGETGLKAASVCGSRHWNKPLSSPDEKVRAEGLAALQQTIRDAKRYGATSILLVPGVARNGVTFQECWDRSIAGIRQAIPLCEETGVKIAIENVWNDFIMKPQQAKDYYKVNALGVGAHFAFPKQRLNLGFKYFKEFANRSTFQGYAVQVSGSYKF